jgi:hypothetical protein
MQFSGKKSMGGQRKESVEQENEFLTNCYPVRPHLNGQERQE